MDFRGTARHPVEELTVMAHRDERTTETFKEFFEPDEGIDVKMIGGFVE